MKVINSISEIPKIENAVLTNGTFDGLHIGHQKILSQLKNSAKAFGGKSVVLTYWPHPRIVLGKESDDFKLLYSLEDRKKHIEAFGIDYLIVLEFTKEFANLSSEEFIQSILVDKIGVKKLILGYNHRFGRNREGGFDYLKENAHLFGFEIEEIPKQLIEEEGVSSTKIRKALSEGNILLANAFLTKRFSITGKVVKGAQIGRNIGFPTANISIAEPYKLIPAVGVYAVKVNVSGLWYTGMLNIGNKPTLGTQPLSIEVHIFDFGADIYGEEITIEFIDKIRNEQKFASLDDLASQLKNDKNSAQKILQNHD